MKYILAIGVVGLIFWGASSYLGNSSVPRSNEPNRAQEVQSSIVQTDSYIVDEGDLIEGDRLVADLEHSDLSATETTGLLFMREEEKLARDVYQVLYDRWGAQVFHNIAKSEQTHMDAMLTLIKRYDLVDSAQTGTGSFTNPQLQQLYDELTAEGNKSLVAAYRVGALIEDLDIKDLDEQLVSTDQEDIRLVYENLQRGSRNHLRAFNKQLVRETGDSYTSQYISQATFDDIVAGDTERGAKGGLGSGYKNR